MNIAVLLALLGVVQASGPASRPGSGPEARTTPIDRVAVLSELRDLLAIPNVASDSDTPNIERNAAALSEMLRRRGIEPRLLRVKGAPPVVFGELRTPGAKETLVLYAHYDGQPVDRGKWASDPWTPVIRTNLVENGGKETHAAALMQILDKHRDLLVRRVMGLELTTYGPLRPLHSGHYGNWAPNPLATLANVLACMRDDDGRILIDGFYDDVRALAAAERAALTEAPAVEEQLKRELALGRTEGTAPLVERIAAPALNIRGIRGGGGGETAANVISPEATASIDFRLVPDQTPECARARVEAHLRSRGFHIVHETPDAATRRAHARVVKVEWEAGYPPSRVALDNPTAAAIERRIEAALGAQVIKLPTLGGSVPLYLFPTALGVPIVNHDNNEHGANENLRLQNLWNGIEVFEAILGGR